MKTSSDSIIYECLDGGCSVLESELEDIREMELFQAVGCDTNKQTYTSEVAITSMKMKDKHGSTLVHYANMNGCDDTVRTLLEGGEYQQWKNPLMFACALWHY